MPNVGKIISKQNRKKLSNHEPKIQKDCNCRDKPACVIGGKCNLAGVIYSAKVTRLDDQKTETYTGLTQDPVKRRIQKHNFTFNNPNYKNETTLSNYIWQLKSKNVNFNLEWQILARAQPYNPGSKICNLCNSEVFHIFRRSHSALGTKGQN